MLPGHHVPRPRLVAVIESAPVAAMVAPGGYGKTTLAAEVALALGARSAHIVVPEAADGDGALLLAAARRGLESAGVHSAALAAATTVDALAAAVDDALVRSAGPTVVVLDEIQRAGAPGVALAARLAATTRPPHRLLLLGRRLPDGVHAPVTIGPAELAFAAGEVVTLYEAGFGVAIDAGRAAFVTRALDGWPVAVALVASQHRHLGLDPTATLDEALARLVGAGLEDVLAVIAHLPRLSPGVVDATLGAGSWTRLVDAGIPVAPDDAGWFRLADPIRDRLRVRRDLTVGQADAAAAAYVGAGAVADGVAVLLDHGHTEAAARLIGSLRGSELERLEPAELRALLHVLGSRVVARVPRVLLQHARLLSLAAHIPERTEALARARTAAVETGDLALVREVDAEVAHDLARNSRIDEALTLGGAIVAAAGERELAARARGLAAMGLAEAYSTAPGSAHRADALLTESIALARHLGEAQWESQARQWLGYWVHYGEGNIDAAVRELRRAVELLGVSDRRRGAVATFLAEVLLRAGRREEAMAPLDEARRIGVAWHDALTLAYVEWIAAEAATQRGDADDALARLAAVERHRAEWWEHSTGADFLAAASEMCRRLGRIADAARYLDRAAGREQGTLPSVTMAQATLAAEVGDLDDAGPLLEASLAAAPEIDRPRLLLFKAVVARRRDQPEADDLARRAIEAAAALGLPDLLASAEPRAVAGFDALASPSGGLVEVRLLGGFAVLRTGEPVALPPGQAETLVKRLALRGRAWPVDEAIDAFWPEADLEVGRRRLRNLLNRLRVAADVVIRVGPGLCIDPSVTIDVVEFRRAADIAVAAGTASLEALRAAIDRYAGGLLPDDPYDDWAMGPREQLAIQYLALLDRAATTCEEGGDTAGALDLRQRAVAADPFDETRYVEAARVALAAGQPAAARLLLSRATAMLAELGLEPGAAHAALLARVG